MRSMDESSERPQDILITKETHWKFGSSPMTGRPQFSAVQVKQASQGTWLLSLICFHKKQWLQRVSEAESLSCGGDRVQTVRLASALSSSPWEPEIEKLDCLDRIDTAHNKLWKLGCLNSGPVPVLRWVDPITHPPLQHSEEETRLPPPPPRRSHASIDPITPPPLYHSQALTQIPITPLPLNNSQAFTQSPLHAFTTHTHSPNHPSAPLPLTRINPNPNHPSAP